MSRPALAAMLARVAVGPLALAAFFLPWGKGTGPLAAYEFSGYGLVAMADRLQVLELARWERVALLGVRVLILGVAIAAAWQILLAAKFAWHPAFAWSRGYLVAAAFVATVAAMATHGPHVPPAGLLLLDAAAVSAIAPAFVRSLRRLLPAPCTRAALEAAPEPV